MGAVGTWSYDGMRVVKFSAGPGTWYYQGLALQVYSVGLIWLLLARL